jgi:hypothetical protein
MIYRGPAFLAFVLFVSLPTPFCPSPVSKLDRRHTGRLRKRDNLLTGEEEGVRGEAELYESERAWSSVNHSILSGVTYSSHFLSLSTSGWAEPQFRQREMNRGGYLHWLGGGGGSSKERQDLRKSCELIERSLVNRGLLLEHWQKVVGKSTFWKARAFTNISWAMTEKIPFHPCENNCSCAMEFETNSACAVDLHIWKVAQLLF